MTDFFDWAFSFLRKILEVPELFAVLTGLFAGMAVSYLLTLPLPSFTPVKVAKQYARGVVFITVMIVSMTIYRTPRTAAWGFTIAIMAPLFHEWLFTILYHKWPWLKPKALQTGAELNNSKETSNASKSGS